MTINVDYVFTVPVCDYIYQIKEWDASLAQTGVLYVYKGIPAEDIVYSSDLVFHENDTEGNKVTIHTHDTSLEGRYNFKVRSYIHHYMIGNDIYKCDNSGDFMHTCGTDTTAIEDQLEQ